MTCLTPRRDHCLSDGNILIGQKWWGILQCPQVCLHSISGRYHFWGDRIACMGPQMLRTLAVSFFWVSFHSEKHHGNHICVLDWLNQTFRMISAASTQMAMRTHLNRFFRRWACDQHVKCAPEVQQKWTGCSSGINKLRDCPSSTQTTNKILQISKEVEMTRGSKILQSDSLVSSPNLCMILESLSQSWKFSKSKRGTSWIEDLERLNSIHWVSVYPTSSVFYVLNKFCKECQTWSLIWVDLNKKWYLMELKLNERFWSCSSSLSLFWQHGKWIKYSISHVDAFPRIKTILGVSLFENSKMTRHLCVSELNVSILRSYQGCILVLVT